MIHYSSSAIPIGYFFIEKYIVLLILALILVSLAVIELLKYKNDFIYSLYMKFFKDMLREHEYDRSKFRINGATWVLLSAIFCILVFPKLVAIFGLLMLSFADSTSALLGRLYGKKQYAPNRSYVGTIVFFIVGVIIMFLTPKYSNLPKEYWVLGISVAATTIADALSIPVDDNFTIPVTACLVSYLLYMLLFPGFSIS